MAQNLENGRIGVRKKKSFFFKGIGIANSNYLQEHLPQGRRIIIIMMKVVKMNMVW